MENNCYRCGAVVVDGTPFCAGCGAPQIRVLTVEPPPQEAANPLAPEPYHDVPTSTGIQWSTAWSSAALGGLLASLFIVIPFGGVGIQIVAAGAFAVMFYHRRVPFGILTRGRGAWLGAMGGLVAYGVFAIIQFAQFRSDDSFRARLLDVIQQSIAKTPDPQAQAMLSYFKTPSGLALFMGIGMFAMLFVFLICSALGGVLGLSIVRRKERF